MRSTRTTRRSGRSRRRAACRSTTTGVVRERIELARIDGDRTSHGLRHVARIVDRGAVQVGADHGRSCLGEQPPPALGVKADEIVRQQPVVHRPAHVRRQHAPAVEAHPGDVHEVRKSRVRAALANESRREVQVVVVEEHHGAGLLLELVDDCVCEAAVHLHVAAVPGLVERLVESRRSHEIPEPVLDEPQHRVRNDVVVAVVRGRIVRDEPQPERRLASRNLVEGAVVGLLRDGAILVADRAGDPRHVVVRREAVDGGDEAAATPAGNATARFVAAVRDRAAVGDHDQPPARHETGWGTG